MYAKPKFHYHSFKIALKEARQEYPNIDKPTLEGVLAIGYEYGWDDGVDDGNSSWEDD